MTPLAAQLTAAIEIGDRPNEPHNQAMARLLAESPVPVLTPEEEAEIDTAEAVPQGERDPEQVKRVCGLISRAMNHYAALERRTMAAPGVAEIVAAAQRVRDAAMNARRLAAATITRDSLDARGLPVTHASVMDGRSAWPRYEAIYGVRAAIPGGLPCPWCGANMVYPPFVGCPGPAFCEDDDTHVAEYVPWGA